MGQVQAVRHLLLDGPRSAGPALDQLREEFSPAREIVDLALLGGAEGPALPGGGRNPCATPYFLLEHLVRDPARGPLLLFKAERDGSALAVVVTPCGP